jgi:Tfp pilus assembly protein PilF
VTGKGPKAGGQLPGIVGIISFGGSLGVTFGLIAILAIYAALFGRAVNHGYVWDDVSTLATSDFFDRPLSRALLATEHERMDEALTAMRGVSFGHESYRPVNVATHWFDVNTFGRRPWPMHAHSLLWGAVGVLLAFLLATEVLGDRRWALLVAAIFAVHPLHVEPFVYISARADLVSGALALLAAVAFMRSTRMEGRRAQTLWLGGAAVTTLSALFAKESAMALPIGLFAFAIAWGRTRAAIVGFGVLMATVLVHFPLRAALVPAAPLANTGYGATFARLPGIVVQYFEALLLPLAISNARPLDPALTRWGWPLLLAATVTVALTFAWARRGSTRGQQPSEPTSSSPSSIVARFQSPPDIALVLAGLVWAAAFIAPAAVAVGTLGALADRYAYAALFGFAVAVAALLRRVWHLRQLPLFRVAVTAITGLWLALCVFVSAREVGFWSSNRALYAHAVAVEPASAIAHYRFGVLLAGERRWPEAVAAFSRAADLKQRVAPDIAPSEERVLNNLGVAHLNLGQIADAERSFRAAIARSNNVSYRAWFNLAEIAWARGDSAGTCQALTAALAISPKYRAAQTAHAARCMTPAVGSGNVP